MGVSKHILVDAFSAKTRLQMPGSMVDFIYIFPQGRDHYGLVPPGFVIRPNGDTWSKDWGGVGWLNSSKKGVKNGWNRWSEHVTSTELSCFCFFLCRVQEFVACEIAKAWFVLKSLIWRKKTGCFVYV